MDTITHGLIGTLGSRTGFYQKFGKIATYSFLIGSVFPDIDVIVAVLGPDFTMRYHRGPTHSLIAAPFFCLLLTPIINLIFKSREYRKIYTMILLGMYSHIFFDLITAYGTVLFDPVSSNRYGLNLVFILDPIITILVLIGLVIAIKKTNLAARISLVVFGFLILYLISCYSIRDHTLNKVLSIAEAKNISVNKINIYPRPFAPLRWLVVLETEETFYRLNINSLSTKSFVFQKFPKSDRNSYVDLANSHRIGRLYHWFADFPVAKYKQTEEEHIVEFHDLRFKMLSSRRPFTLIYVFDERSKIKEITLGGRRIKNI